MSGTARVAVPRVLSVAGSDPSGGAGIQADLKSIAALGGYGMAALTALTAQNTRGVRAVHVPPPEFLAAQLAAIGDDIVVDGVKIGMLAGAGPAAVVAGWLAEHRPPVVVLDPVMVATSGDRLLDPAAEQAVRSLARRAHLVTPNIAELAVLTGRGPAGTWDEALAQGRRAARDLGTRVLLKGGHLRSAGARGPVCRDAVVAPDGTVEAEVVRERVATTATHGTGCSLSSALATRAAAGDDWPTALRTATTWLDGALRAGEALAVGGGHGPVDHFHHLRPQAEAADGR
ncbi:bifunctional hydroxymethylpyrimidine kinase/phosphomethylpyrimidine kinase [Nocardioides sp.]|uniref:bifunctional hydroxymethylpyrimidine kinase/phosphomethylpyrimidine kinase n=1 Tax=Nocardioides sp. TaxID=35761 RepID=UPI0035199409